MALKSFWSELEGKRLSSHHKMSRKSKVKWTDQMNEDVLECKRKAQELTTYDRAPVNGNGRKRDT